MNIQWTSDILGDVVQVGFNKGDGINYLLPSIANPAALPLTSNVLVPGLYVYRIDGASIPAGPGTFGVIPLFQTCAFFTFHVASILYPYGVAAGDASLPPADESSALVTLLQSINLYGSSVSSVYVSMHTAHPVLCCMHLAPCTVHRLTRMVSYRLQISVGVPPTPQAFQLPMDSSSLLFGLTWTLHVLERCSIERQTVLPSCRER